MYDFLLVCRRNYVSLCLCLCICLSVSLSPLSLSLSLSCKHLFMKPKWSRDCDHTRFGMVCRKFLWSTYVLNLKSLASLFPVIGKATQNLQNMWSEYFGISQRRRITLIDR